MLTSLLYCFHSVAATFSLYCCNMLRAVLHHFNFIAAELFSVFEDQALQVFLKYRCFLKLFTILTYRLLSRSLYKNELESKWPGNRVYSHWDIWMRRNENRKGRECIIPDISRTYHFGANGLNINKYYQKKLFDPRALNKESHQIFDIEKMMKNNYEKELQRLIRYIHFLAIIEQ